MIMEATEHQVITERAEMHRRVVSALLLAPGA
jgi:hypothetical protein